MGRKLRGQPVRDRVQGRNQQRAGMPHIERIARCRISPLSHTLLNSRVSPIARVWERGDGE